MMGKLQPQSFEAGLDGPWFHFCSDALAMDLEGHPELFGWKNRLHYFMEGDTKYSAYNVNQKVRRISVHSFVICLYLNSCNRPKCKM